MRKIDFTELKGVGQTVADKLVQGGYSDYLAIAISVPAELALDCDIGVTIASKIIDEARRKADVGEVITALSIYKKEKKKIDAGAPKLSTGSKEVDKIIGGGIEGGSLTECFGEYGSGKTQLAFQLSVNVAQMKDLGGQEAEVIYLDTEGTFRVGRCLDMIEAQIPDDYDKDIAEVVSKVLSRIKIIRIYSSEHQVFVGEELRKADPKNKCKLVVVDSLTSFFRAEYTGRGKLSERQQLINRHMHDIKKFIQSRDAVSFMTNQVYSRPDMFGMSGGNPVGGNIIGHNATTRLSIRKASGEKRIIKIIDSPDMPVAEAVCRVTSEGIRDE